MRLLLALIGLAVLVPAADAAPVVLSDDVVFGGPVLGGGQVVWSSGREVRGAPAAAPPRRKPRPVKAATTAATAATSSPMKRTLNHAFSRCSGVAKPPKFMQ